MRQATKTRPRRQPGLGVGLLAALVAALLALPASADAVLSGTNGRIVFSSGRIDDNDSLAKLYLRTVTSGTGAGTTGPTITPQGGVQHRHPSWSPDRTKIAYARGTPGSPTTENFDLYIRDLTTPGSSSTPWRQEPPPT